ncbi:MAG: helical backbone metal receptor [Helicobacteraceae bacterium]|jgi:iron complex transport system substrate-binding protein|nr:helical backbone metal receptor [Helicobacteraceae bacterium]
MRLIISLLIALSLFGSERIITLSPAVAEITAALGAEDEIVGVSEYTYFPQSLQSRPKIGGYFSLSLEKIIALRPTIVIGLPHQEKLLSQLESFKIKTLQLQLKKIDDIKHAINTVATELGREEDAKGLIKTIEESQRSAPKLPDKKEVLIVFANASGIDKGVYVAGHDLYFEEILHLCGAQNAYKETYSAQPLLHIEGLIATNPDTILLLFGQLDRFDAEAVMQSWQKLPINAVKNRSVKIIQSDYLLIPSHRIAKSIKTICEAIQ